MVGLHPRVGQSQPHGHPDATAKTEHPSRRPCPRPIRHASPMGTNVHRSRPSRNRNCSGKTSGATPVLVTRSSTYALFFAVLSAPCDCAKSGFGIKAKQSERLVEESGDCAKSGFGIKAKLLPFRPHRSRIVQRADLESRQSNNMEDVDQSGIVQRADLESRQSR